MFVGEYDRSVDGNGRLALPSSFRDLLGDRCYATRDRQGCLTIRTVERFNDDATRMITQVDEGELSMAAQRALATSSAIVAIDKQGRITLDDDARRHAGIPAGTQASIVGNLKEVQIWRPSRYRTVKNEDGVDQPIRRWDDDNDDRDEPTDGDEVET